MEESPGRGAIRPQAQPDKPLPSLRGAQSRDGPARVPRPYSVTARGCALGEKAEAAPKGAHSWGLSANPTPCSSRKISLSCSPSRVCHTPMTPCPVKGEHHNPSHGHSIPSFPRTCTSYSTRPSPWGSQQALSAYCMPGSIPGTGTQTRSCPCRAHFCGGLSGTHKTCGPCPALELHATPALPALQLKPGSHLPTKPL